MRSSWAMPVFVVGSGLATLLTGCEGEAPPSPATTKPAVTVKAKPTASATVTATATATATAAAAPAAKFAKLADAEVDAKQKAAAQKFATDYFGRAKAGKFEPLGDEATAEMKAALTPEVQKKADEATKGLFGAYKSLEFVEAWKSNEGPAMNIYRFKGTFEKDKPEVRVVMDSAGKVAGFWARPWQDSIDGSKPTKLAEDKVDAKQKAAAEKLGTDLLGRWKAGKFAALGDEATPEVQKALTTDLQKKGYEDAKKLFGDYQSLAYAESWVDDASKLTIYRFRGAFAKDKPEVRVVLNADGKLAGLWIKPWADQLQ